MSIHTIRVKAMCIIIREGRVLVADGKSLRGKAGGRVIVPGDFYRVLGGSIDFSEKTDDAVRREIREELRSELENIERLDVIENVFEYAGAPGHDIVFLFKGDLVRKELYAQDTIHVDEGDYEFEAKWVPVRDILEGDTPLYPSLDWKRFL